MKLAQLNIARMLAPIDSPVMKDFVDNLDPINTLAENSPGFVWRLKGDGNDATSLRIYDDDFMIVNMSVWEDIPSLTHYVYHTVHVEIFKRRKEWFEKLKDQYSVLWYVPDGHYPTVAEAVNRLEYLRAHRETPYAFTFKRQFTSAEASTFNNQPA